MSMSLWQDADSLAWDRHDELWDESIKQARLSSVCRKMAALATKMLGKPATFVSPLVMGGYNVLYPMRIEAPSHSESATMNVLVRVPCSEGVFLEEKTLAEAATARCISQRTPIPIPEVFSHGVDPDLGPFIIIQDLGSRRTFNAALAGPRDSPGEPPVLQTDISETRLKSLYGKLARLVLQLAQQAFPRIGTLVETSPGFPQFQVTGRPLTINMGEMVIHANIPTSIFPPKGTTYRTANEWYTVLAEMQMATLVFQHNDLVSSEDDCKTKYVARQLFRRLATQGRLSSFGFAQDGWSAAHGRNDTRGTRLPAPDGSGSFRLWSDDFRPGNVVVDGEDNILGVIDWEFTYAAPTQFALDPPWWLLIESPDDTDLDRWASDYEIRLQTWLSVMEEAEQDLAPGALLLSAYMRESWATGRFWLNYAARRSWAFDIIYWKYLDQRFFGERDEGVPEEELWKTRVHLLTKEERAAMEPLVKIKMEEAKERVLVDWEADEARERLSSFLFD